MKGKILKAVIALVLAGMMCGCDNSLPDNTEVEIPEDGIPSLDADGLPVLQIATLNDPSAMGMVKMLDNSDSGLYEDVRYEIKAYDSSDELIADFENGDINIANVSCNIAADIYARSGGGVSVGAINAMGSDYIAERLDRVNFLNELRGRNVSLSAKGTTTDYVLRYLLNQEQMDLAHDLDLVYEDNYSAVAQNMLNDDWVLGVMPIHVLLPVFRENPDAEISIALSLMGEWANFDSETTYVSSVTIVKNDYLTDNLEDYNNFLERYGQSVEFVLKPENINVAAHLIAQYGIMENESYAREVVPLSAMTFKTGEEMKELISTYLGIMYEFDPSYMGGALPDDGFYYLG